MSPLVLCEWKLLPEYLLNLWPSCFFTGCSSHCPISWSNECSFMSMVVWAERKVKNKKTKKHMNKKSDSSDCSKHVSGSRPHRHVQYEIWITNEKIRLDFSSVKNRRRGGKTRIGTLSAAASQIHLIHSQKDYSHIRIHAPLLPPHNIIDLYAFYSTHGQQLQAKGWLILMTTPQNKLLPARANIKLTMCQILWQSNTWNPTQHSQKKNTLWQ